MLTSREQKGLTPTPAPEIVFHHPQTTKTLHTLSANYTACFEMPQHVWDLREENQDKYGLNANDVQRPLAPLLLGCQMWIPLLACTQQLTGWCILWHLHVRDDICIKRQRSNFNYLSSAETVPTSSKGTLQQRQQQHKQPLIQDKHTQIRQQTVPYLSNSSSSSSIISST